MTKTLQWNVVGMGVSLAAGYFPVGGKSLWVDFMATAEGRGKKRTWSVSANHYGENAKPNRVILTKVECFRYEATDLALAELTKLLTGATTEMTSVN